MPQKSTYQELEQRVQELEKETAKLKKTGEALRESEEQYRKIIENMQEGLWIIDKDANTIFVNSPMAEMLGYTEEEMLGENLFEFMDKKGIENAKILIKRRQNGVKEQHDFEFLRKDASRLYAILEATPLFDNEGHYSGALASIMDISERRETEKSLYESKEKYRKLFEEARDGIFLADTETGIFIDCNYAATRLVGRGKSKLIGQHQSIIHPTSQANGSFSETFKKHLGESEGQILETQVITSTGEIKEVAIKANLLHLGNREILQGIFHDITDCKKAEEALKTSQMRLADAMDMARIVYWELDLKSREFTFNDAFYDLYGTTADAEGGYRMKTMDYSQRFIHPEDFPMVRRLVGKVEQSGNSEYVKQIEHRIIRRDGEIRHLTVLARGVEDTSGKVIQIHGVNQDITDHKRIEEDLLRSQKLESVGLLAGGIAHDFNNILTTILGNVSMAKDQLAPRSEILELLNEAETALKRAQTLTKQLLTFAKGGTPVKEAASIRNIIKESSLFVMRGSKSSCDFSIAEDLWSAEVDIGQISQVINNIVINANQAMPEGGTIKIKAENLIIDEGNKLYLKHGRYIKISFKDQGIGIAEKHLSKIFDPYFTTKQEGSGLGLATAYSIIKNHGGVIMVESMLGIGTTFKIYLPASENATPEKSEDEIIKGRGKILLMDDEASLRKIAGRMLDKLGYEPEFAKDGDEAIRMVKEAKEAKKSYDALILDLTIPGGMGGKEAIQKLLEIAPEIKAIVSSGYSDDPVLANFHEYGFKGMIPKPFDSRSLSKVLHDVLKG